MLEVVSNLCSNSNCACITADKGIFCSDHCKKQEDDPDAVDYCHCAHNACSEMDDDSDLDADCDLSEDEVCEV